jgi:hypothetical protein
LRLKLSTKYSLSLFSVLLSASSPAAFADPIDPDEGGAECVNFVCQVESKREDVESNIRSPQKGDGQTRSGGGVEDRRQEELRKAKAEFDRKVAVFEREYVAYTQCVLRGTSTCGRPSPPDPYLMMSWSNNGGGPPAVLITPAQAGAIAVARLRLPTVAPGIGPPPDLNRWNMAAVGYPLWLWADGPTHVGPVSDSVAGLNVSLEADVTSLTFRMGDGNTVECSGVGDRWTKAVEPGTKAPDCGYTYTEPSLPKGNYTVSAVTNWAVTWTANGQSGVINVPAVETTELPVGELQVLVR